ncbi:Ribonuclease H1 [Sergentomyia squamirostris]
MSNTEYLDVWTDASCMEQGQKSNTAGRGVYFGKDHPWNVSERGSLSAGPPDINGVEIQAAKRAIQIAKKNGVKKLRINTDSSYLITGITENLPKWLKNGWVADNGEDVKNKAEFLQLSAELDGTIHVIWRHVSSHSGHFDNNQADRLARAGAAIK